jgi:hypothetical protein
MPAQLWCDQLCTGPIRYHPPHDTINISQRLRTAAAHIHANRALGASFLPFCFTPRTSSREAAPGVHAKDSGGDQDAA